MYMSIQEMSQPIALRFAESRLTFGKSTLLVYT